MRGAALLLAALAACAGAERDPCEGLELPACPEPCPAGAGCGSACETEGAACGNEIGDGMRCRDGTWQDCTVHAPLGGPGTCNLVCRPKS